MTEQEEIEIAAVTSVKKCCEKIDDYMDKHLTVCAAIAGQLKGINKSLESIGHFLRLLYEKNNG